MKGPPCVYKKVACLKIEKRNFKDQKQYPLGTERKGVLKKKVVLFLLQLKRKATGAHKSITNELCTNTAHTQMFVQVIERSGIVSKNPVELKGSAPLSLL